MKNMMLCFVALIALSASELYSQVQTDSSHHTVQFVTVEPGVQLEVLDWGGSGRPLIFLAGAGDTAHRFDSFAPQFTAKHHVYGITRRGSGASSKPAPANGNYAADHLGDDVLAVMQALHIERPVLVGHSIAGQELSSIGSRFPEKVSGLVYLDAATGFAFYDPAHPRLEIEMNDIKRRIDEIEAGGVDEKKKLLELEAASTKFETVLHQSNAEIANLPPLPPRSPIGAALNFGAQKYTSIPVTSTVTIELLRSVVAPGSEISSRAHWVWVFTPRWVRVAPLALRASRWQVVTRTGEACTVRRATTLSVRSSSRPTAV